MKRVTGFLVLLLLLGLPPRAWAGVEEELAQLIQQADQAFDERNLDVWMAAWADNAVLTPSPTPFRIEGKEAVRAFWAGFFQAFPTGRVVPRQRSIRVYGGTTAVLNEYWTATLVDRAGKVTTRHGRWSATLVKLGDRWVVVDAHSSVAPASP